MAGMADFIVNTSDYELRLARESLLSGLAGALDTKRPQAWTQYGYPQQVTFAQLLTAYERGGPARGAVHRLLDKCWQARPRVKRPEDDKPGTWEKGVEKVFKAAKLWPRLRDFDRRNLVGHFAALIYRVADSRELSEPLTTAQKLVEVVPVYESQIKVTRWHQDKNDAENYGKPAMYQCQSRDLSKPTNPDLASQPVEWFDVHPSRVQILAEGSAGGDMFDGVPLLLAGFNSLVDLEKVSGGSAENFLKNSARSLVIKFDKDASPQVLTTNPDGSPSGKDVSEVIGEKVQKLNRNIDAAMVLQGGEASTLQTQQSDPTKAFEVAATMFAASVQIPFTILFGQQTGRLASDEDKADMNARCTSRQLNELTPMLEEFVQRMQACGVIEKGEFEIEWPPLDAPGDAEKFDLLDKATAAMQKASAAGLVEPIFDANELRKIVGYEEREDDGMPDEGDEAAELEASRQHELALRGLPAPTGKPVPAKAAA